MCHLRLGRKPPPPPKRHKLCTASAVASCVEAERAQEQEAKAAAVEQETRARIEVSTVTRQLQQVKLELEQQLDKHRMAQVQATPHTNWQQQLRGAGGCSGVLADDHSAGSWETTDEEEAGGWSAKEAIIFHDAENCYIGKAASSVTPGELAINIYESVVGRIKEAGGSDKSISWQFYLHHAAPISSHPCLATLRELTSLGVDHVDPGSKRGAVDMKMKAKMAEFVKEHSATPDRFIVVILSGDGDFLHEIRAVKDAGFQTVVAHPANVSEAFKHVAARDGGDVIEWDALRHFAGGLAFGEDVARGGSAGKFSRVTDYSGVTPTSATGHTGQYRYAPTPTSAGDTGDHKYPTSSKLGHRNRGVDTGAFGRYDTSDSSWEEIGNARMAGTTTSSRTTSAASSDESSESEAATPKAHGPVVQLASPSKRDDDIDGWLAAAKLGSYADVIKEYGYDSIEVLRDADEEDIQEMVTSEGPHNGFFMKKPHQRSMIKAWKKMQAMSAAAAGAA